jgi:hypothetical protein
MRNRRLINRMIIVNDKRGSCFGTVRELLDPLVYAEAAHDRAQLTNLPRAA